MARYWRVGIGQTYAAPQAAFDALLLVVGNVALTQDEIIEIYSGTYEVEINDCVLVISSINPTVKFRLIIKAADGEIVNFNISQPNLGAGGFGIIGTQINPAHTHNINYVHIEGINFITSDLLNSMIAVIPGVSVAVEFSFFKGWIVNNCTFGTNITPVKFYNRTRDFSIYNSICTGYGDPINGQLTGGVFRAENCFFYGSTGPIIHYGPGADPYATDAGIVIINHCTIVGDVGGIRLTPDADNVYRIFLELNNNIIVCINSGNQLYYQIKEDVGIHSISDLLNITKSDGNIFYNINGSDDIFGFGDWAEETIDTLASLQAYFRNNYNSQYADPLFINCDAEGLPDPDVQLSSGSPGFMAGVAITETGVEGRTRASSIDIGPYQVSSDGEGSSNIMLNEAIQVIVGGETQ